MTAFNRNVITRADISNFQEASSPADIPVSLDISPPAGAIQTAEQPTPARPAPDGPPPGIVPVPSADDFLTKLVKYVPLEILGFYLLVAGVIESNVEDRERSFWLGGLLAFVLIAVIPYDVYVLNVVRKTQITMSVIGLAVYVFAVGGWFATTSWYEDWHATIVLALFGLAVAILKLKPLPASGG